LGFEDNAMRRTARRLEQALTLAMRVLSLVPAVARTQDQPKVHLLVPAYFYPSGEGEKPWARVIEASARVPIVAIVNPDSGPGKTRDPNYMRVFERARGSKLTLIGYVPLGYARRPVGEVKDDVDRWIQLYPRINGFFFDEQPSGADQAPFVLECFAHARQRLGHAVLVSNPGVLCAPEYLEGEQPPVVCLFEHERGFDTYRSPAWVHERGAQHFATLHYHRETAERMKSLVAESLAQGAAFVYVTDAGGANPWDRLPTYWASEVDEVARRNRDN
jgi:hypothetical protein